MFTSKGVAMSTVSRFIAPSLTPRCLPVAAASSLRRYSTPAAGALPLEGYRVLDMTRVLAGVSLPNCVYSLRPLIQGKHSRTVRRFWATLGKPPNRMVLPKTGH